MTTVAITPTMTSNVLSTCCSDTVWGLSHTSLLFFTTIPQGPHFHSHLTETKLRARDFLIKIFPLASCLLFIISISSDHHSTNSTCTPLWPIPLPHLKNIIMKFSNSTVIPRRGSTFHANQKPLTIWSITNLRIKITSCWSQFISPRHHSTEITLSQSLLYSFLATTLETGSSNWAKLQNCLLQFFCTSCFYITYD